MDGHARHGETTAHGAAGGLEWLRGALAALAEELAERAAAAERAWRDDLVRPEFQDSALNLAAYLALRAGDRTALQRALRVRGLSTLGRSEAHVRATVAAIAATLDGRDAAGETAAAMERAHAVLMRETAALMGPRPAGRRTRILVTLEPAFGADETRMGELVRRGANAVRINCAHDTADDWRRMAAVARRAAAAQGRQIRVLMDLSGPKIRTADVRPEPGVRLREGDRLVIRRAAQAPHPQAARASCACTLSAVVDEVGAGASAMIDDGKFAADVERVDEAGLWLRITRTKPGGARLKEDKGLNFPGAALTVSPLTERDLRDLDVVCEIADMVGYSFVQRAADVRLLHEELARRAAGRPPLGVIAKIETALAVRNLPALIVAGAGRAPFGVMIARGDLGVEIGFPRLSEIQEELLWLCEAARVPVVWATEVLADLVRSGVASRGEFTDAAMSARAECVMLNKGAHLAEGVSVLDDVLCRAERHFDKKTPQLPALRSWSA